MRFGVQVLRRFVYFVMLPHDQRHVSKVNCVACATRAFRIAEFSGRTTLKEGGFLFLLPDDSQQLAEGACHCLRFHYVFLYWPVTTGIVAFVGSSCSALFDNLPRLLRPDS